MRPQQTRDEIVRLLTADPGLPVASPTQSYWQRDPHALASTRSPVLPRTVDIAIIGSGVTGASVSKAILENDPKLRVALFEARTLCSGATGRNGGQLATAAGGDYSSLVANFGAETAGKIVNLTIKTTSKMREMILKYAPTSCDFQDTTKIRVYLDSASFQAAKSSVEQLERDHPLLKGEFKIIGSQKIKDYGISKGYGAMLHRAGSVWPYRFITKVFEALLEQHRARFTIETNTPVTSITYDGPGSHPYQLHTPRGTVRCTKVIHCTNGYAGHLLPGLRGCMFPLTGSMTVQNLQSSIPNRGTSYSWGFHYLMRQDYQTGKIMDGLQYLIQSPKSNLFFFGGDYATWEELLHADDSRMCDTSVDVLQKTLPLYFEGKEKDVPPQKGKLVSAWTGTMGFSADGVPVVGQVPSSLSLRRGSGEFAAVAFNGYGMPNCWLVGEVLAKLALGGTAPEWFPDCYLITDKRLQTSLTLERSIGEVQLPEVQASKI